MKPPKYRSGSNPPETPFEKDLENNIDKLFAVLAEVLDSGLTFDDNSSINRKSITTSGTPDTEAAVSHNLKRVPVGYFVVGRDKAGVIYNGTTAWTTTNIYLRSNVATVTATVIIF